MKKKNKLVAMALGCVAAAALGCATINTATASAAETNADKFEMQFGVQMALKKDAMRWIVEMGQNVYDEIVTNDKDEKVSLSVIVSSKTQFDSISDGNYINIQNKNEIEIPEEDIYFNAETGYYYANAAISGLYTTEQSNKELLAVGVIVTEGENEQYTYEYADFYKGDASNNVRKQYEVLQWIALDTSAEARGWVSVILGEKSPYKSWFGTEAYPLIVDTEEEYNDFITQINTGFTFDLNVELYSKVITKDSVKLNEDMQLPESLKSYHEVNFYNGEELLETVVVEDGGEAVCSTELKSYSTELLYANTSNYVKGKRFSGWALEDGTKVDISSISESMNLYAQFTDGNVTEDLKAYAKEEEANVPIYFDREFGFTSIQKTPGGSEIKAKEYVTDFKLTGEKGSTKLTYDVTGDMYATLVSEEVKHDENDYISFSVYLDAPENITAVWVRLGSTPGVQVVNKTWGLVTFKASNFYKEKDTETGEYVDVLKKTLMFTFRGYNTETPDEASLYFSKATIIPEAKVKNLTKNGETETYQIGNTTFVGTAYKWSWGDDFRTDIFNQDTELQPTLINGQLMWYEDDTKATARAVGLEFETAIGGTVYVVARGLGEGAEMQIFTEREVAKTHKATPGAKLVEELEDGYKLYSFNFGANAIKYVRFYAAGEYPGGQILVKSIYPAQV